ncbi:Zinc finger CCCH domain-containing protein [Actinidia chinensis var. chinensis]|uniref:Zinc finger CCCH domain-containing protein n=1 Tax=Actinidia chinensis var. chinensis TaxID=1590841 RepID=A0A2R6PWH4_ACTCC|nr:Zinc finger CCCH domain-containing protein [Actinidia chinensis var. chinensis]
MDVKASRRVAERTHRSIYYRLSGGTVNSICAIWLAGRCTCNPCRFLHMESPTSKPPKQSQNHRSNTWHRGSNNSFKNSSPSPIGGSGTESKTDRKTQTTVCQYWLSGNCLRGEKCEHLYFWFCGNGFSMVAKLERHDKAVAGIALPSGSDNLYTGYKDKTCVDVVSLLGEVGSLISESPWVFVGLPNAVKAWNIQTQAELNFTGPIRQVYAMVMDNEYYFSMSITIEFYYVSSWIIKSYFQ